MAATYSCTDYFQDHGWVLPRARDTKGFYIKSGYFLGMIRASQPGRRGNGENSTAGPNLGKCTYGGHNWSKPTNWRVFRLPKHRPAGLGGADGGERVPAKCDYRQRAGDFAVAAMIQAKNHLKKLECYACHSTWAPQCYGCHVKVDYSEEKASIDWIASGNIQFPDGHTAESRRDGNAIKGRGKSTETHGYLRWENPVLGINGEGRVCPIIPGCQQITTVIGPDGETLVLNKIWRTPANLENSGPEGQRGIDMAPAAPHTRAREARTCASCHTSSKLWAMGLTMDAT